jgi:hypothetical protein
MGTNLDVHVHVFCKTIQANGEKNDVDIINIFCFTLCDAISKWGENFMRAHLICRFEKLETKFCKHYRKVQIDEQVYMPLRMIKQGGDEKVEVYYEHMLKLANCLQHQANDKLLTIFF